MAQQAHAIHIGQALHIIPNGSRFGQLLFDGHVLLAAFALTMSTEVEADGGDAGFGKTFRKLRHGDIVLAGEDAVHQDHHRALVCRWVKPVGQSDLIGNLAFGATNNSFLCLATQ